MKKSKLVMIGVLGILIICVLIFTIVIAKNNSGNTSSRITAESSESRISATTDSTKEAAEEKFTTNETATKKYIELSEYNSSSDLYSNSKKIYFFHAKWCYICQGIHNELVSSPDKLPDNTVLIKTDFDTETELRKQYGVTTQYTFVQVDNDGNEIKQWSATTLDKVIAGIL